MRSCTGIILAGGASRRMGRDKAWIEFGGRPLIVRVVEALAPLCDELIIVSGNPTTFQGLPARAIADLLPGKGSLGGIYSGLKAALHGLSMVVACDMPFLNVPLLSYMVSLAKDWDVVIPAGPGPRLPNRSRRDKSARFKGNAPTAKDNDLHPLHAVYSKQCIEPMRKRLDADDLRMIGFHSEVHVRLVQTEEIERFDPEHLSLFNVNTPDDLQVAEAIAAKSSEKRT